MTASRRQVMTWIGVLEPKRSFLVVKRKLDPFFLNLALLCVSTGHHDDLVVSFLRMAGWHGDPFKPTAAERKAIERFEKMSGEP